ncbi:xanthine dehydrogenase family protein molybdopterin-binding subunit [Thiocapsa bogorovii]|uniref:hypothetical protein n=1 Tax=Thiocapsa bogorovii TaxID=521689 RepID=UPI001E5E47D3|nr:hypothetical protein [Thiocapsa bogorovii]UHD16366.1 hypothetical protein LT988_24515 [Thiocapsa bogorovii]
MRKAECNEISGLYTKTGDAYSAAQKRFDDLLESLAKSDKDGVPAAELVMTQKAVSDALKSGSYALFLRLNLSAGGYYTKKNLWTFFGSLPFYVSGGAIASFVAVDGASGDVRAAGQFQVHSGYYPVDEVEARFLMPTGPGETSGSHGHTSVETDDPT